MYHDLSYGGAHKMLLDKSETYTVKGGNADLRHYKVNPIVETENSLF